MRSMLSVKTSLVFAVVGVSFLCLLGLMLVYRYQMRNYMVERDQELVKEVGVMVAAQYNVASEKTANLAAAASARITSEMEVTAEKNAATDTYRIANYLSAMLGQSLVYIRGMVVMTLPGALQADDNSWDFTNDAGYTLFQFKRTGEGVESIPIAPEARDTVGWWDQALALTKGLILEPYMTRHANDSGVMEQHLETRFIFPIRLNDKTIGAVGLEFCLDGFQNSVASAFAGQEQLGGKNTMLVSPSGVCVGVPPGLDLSALLEPDPASGLPRFSPARYPEIVRAIKDGAAFSRTIVPGASGREIFVSTSPIRHESLGDAWSIVMFQPVDEAIADPRMAFNRQYYATFAMLLVSVLFGLLVANIMSRTLSSTEQWHRTILDRMQIPLGLLDRESRWVYVNPAMATTLAEGDRASMIGKLCRDTMPARGAAFFITTNRPEANPEETLELPVKGNRLLSVTSCQMLDSDKKYVGRLIVGLDISDSKKIAKTLSMAASIARSLDGKSERVLSVAQSLSEAAMEQSSAIEQITATTQDIGDASSDYAKSAKQSYEKAQATYIASGKGASEAEIVASAISNVQDSGQKITAIIKLIDGIAFQTNLLALNASVEAARAGRHGRGFAVVADEVRNLSMRSAKAARETTAAIEEMINRIGNAAESIKKLGETLTGIRENGAGLSANSDEVARLAEQESVNVKQVHISLEQISLSVNQMISVSQETSTLAGSIFEQAASLRRLTHDISPSTDESANNTMAAGGRALPPPLLTGKKTGRELA